MKPFVFIVFVFGVLFKLEAQADFLTLAEQKICDQIKTDDVKIHLVADSLFQYVDEEGDLKTKAYLHYWKALGYYHSSEQPLDSITKYASKSQELFLKINDSNGLFETHTLLGKTLLFLSDWINADSHFKRAKQFANTDFKRFRSEVDDGFKYIFKDQIDSAFVHLYAAKKTLPQLNPQNCWFDFYKTDLYINLGMAEIRRVDYANTDYEKSIKYFKRAIKSYELSETKGIENYLFCLINISYCYRKSGFFHVKSIHLDSARFYLRKYIDLVEKSDIKDKYGKLDGAYGNLGWQLFAEGKAKEGIYEVQRSKDYLDSMYSNLLEKKALEINNSYENKLKNQRIEYLNSENEQIRKNFFLTRIILLIIFLLVVILTLAFFRFRQKNRLLKKQQQEIIQIKDQLEVLLREIHHRIKNNLQVISSFLGIQKRNPNTLDTEVILSQCQDRIQTISLMHEQLYSQKEFEYIAIKFYLKKIIKNHIDTSFEAQNIDVNDKIENHSIDFERGLSLGIILNELLVNAAKYAFVDKRKGSISIVFKKKPSGFLFEVSDNGIGFPDNFAEENSNQSGIGYQIIWAMVNKLNGAMDFKSYKGAIISISFPY